MLLILLGFNIWLIRSELERRKKTLFLGAPIKATRDKGGKKEGNDDK
ncbi:MAG: hypothetical protein MRECE_22c017 [Mycoplasmataceae bacterium CE_OT135]|nr:MAG: hypothetical protein MRECE_22c017 [Mycoplasmataceae bacterium CE_OT135]